MKTKNVKRGSLHAVVGPPELEPSVERKWWVVEVWHEGQERWTDPGYHSTASAVDASDTFTKFGRLMLKARWRVVEVVEKRTEVIRNDGVRRPNKQLSKPAHMPQQSKL